ncbi:MAG: hypothetical protein A3H32_03010 [Betaproteobacteria bacterium RIFCSPLOWO2_02_FULL_63_19]|nr:MAG: hypothetical protein A3H32_03010 [Betaproteobacteria bacterium RIFCSPLOWO2_02_FULL_63_19]
MQGKIGLEEHFAIEDTVMDSAVFAPKDHWIDWPFENIDHAADWFDVASISDADREKIGRTNAHRLFRLDQAP